MGEGRQNSKVFYLTFSTSSSAELGQNSSYWYDNNNEKNYDTDNNNCNNNNNYCNSIQHQYCLGIPCYITTYYFPSEGEKEES